MTRAHVDAKKQQQDGAMMTGLIGVKSRPRIEIKKDS
jgi:hypothetical protein